MKIFIDADGCPVVDIVLRLAAQAGLKAVIVCDTAHEFHRDGDDNRVPRCGQCGFCFG